jgi:hypothetical protein
MEKIWKTPFFGCKISNFFTPSKKSGQRLAYAASWGQDHIIFWLVATWLLLCNTWCGFGCSTLPHPSYLSPSIICVDMELGNKEKTVL